MNIFFEYFLRLLNVLFPRLCSICDRRLAFTEQTICTRCNFHLPRTHFSKQPYDNRMAKMFWGQIPIERAAAFFFYERGSAVTKVILEMKRYRRCRNGYVLGKMFAEEIMPDNFFDSVDLMIPIPLSKKRKRKRGYNQSNEIARGINAITNIPFSDDIVIRKSFKQSQTKMDRWQRLENVKDVFELKDPSATIGKHILIIDDVVTTGATVISCAQAIMKGNNYKGNEKFSVLSLGYTSK